MKKRIILTAVALAVIHFVLAIGSLMVAFGSGMEVFNNPDVEPPAIERVAGRLSGALMQPGASLWTPWMSQNMPDAVEWALVLVNSIAWGAVLALLLHLPMMLSKRNPDRGGS